MASYDVFRSEKFSFEFNNYPVNQQDKILDFTEIYEEHGLGDFSKYEGKISHSWKGLANTDPDYIYAKSNNLWHYHIGLPEYTQVHDQYKTSDIVLHFERPESDTEITLIDCYAHYTYNGSFYLPSQHYLSKKKD